MSIRSMIVTALILVTALIAFRACAAMTGSVVHAPTSRPAVTSPLDFTVKDIDGKTVDLHQYRGKVVMLVNVASRCGFTPQYEGLEKLYTDKRSKGFVILGFPANNFGGQEPGSDAEIKTFCSAKYDVTFPMMSKVSVKGDDQAPLYKYLTSKETAGDFAGDIGWNFTKFLIDRNGNLIGRFASATKPSDAKLTDAVDAALEGHEEAQTGGAVERKS